MMQRKNLTTEILLSDFALAFSPFSGVILFIIIMFAKKIIIDILLSNTPYQVGNRWFLFPACI